MYLSEFLQACKNSRLLTWLEWPSRKITFCQKNNKKKIKKLIQSIKLKHSIILKVNQSINCTFSAVIAGISPLTTNAVKFQINHVAGFVHTNPTFTLRALKSGSQLQTCATDRIISYRWVNQKTNRSLQCHTAEKIHSTANQSIKRPPTAANHTFWQTEISHDIFIERLRKFHFITPNLQFHQTVLFCIGKFPHRTAFAHLLSFQSPLQSCPFDAPFCCCFVDWKDAQVHRLNCIFHI